MQFHEDDIASDLSVFHRVDDPDEMSGPSYFTKAERLAHYRGVIRDIVLAEEAKTHENGSPPRTTSTTTPATGSTSKASASGDTIVEGTRGALETNVSTAGLIDWE